MTLRGNFVLPDLQEKLDALQDGGSLHITRRDYERLFGVNDVAQARLRNFALGHACVASFADEAILFRKTLNKARIVQQP
jgi:hypothetical protein